MEIIGVVGLGLLGRGIAACLLAHGKSVIVYALDSREYDTAKTVIREAFDELTRHGILADCDGEQAMGRLHCASRLDEFSKCEFVIESITESLSAKRALYAQLEAVLGDDVVIATNTSSMSIADLQAGLKHPGRLIGMHWAEPAYATRFLELVRGEGTLDQAIERACGLAKQLQKEPCIVSSDLPGFIANRLAYAIYREALYLLREGAADAETIDRAFRNSVGLWAAVCGPLRWIDLTGGPALYLGAMNNVLPTLSNASSTEMLQSSAVTRTGKGIVDGSGFYSYSEAEADEWRERFHRHVWTIHSTQQNEFPVQPDDGKTTSQSLTEDLPRRDGANS